MIGAIFTTAVVATVTVYAGCALASQWRAARAVILRTQAELDKAVPYWPAEHDEILATHAELLALLCWRCNDGTGACICSTKCPAQACTGGLGGEDFSDWDREYLDALGITEGTDQ